MTSETKTSGSIYAIGDIHGQLAELHRVLDLIEKDGGKDAQIVFLGDYTDRGPDSRGVIDLLIEGKTRAAIGPLSKATTTTCLNCSCKAHHSTIHRSSLNCIGFTRV